jgi:hypothetical protein
MPHWSPISAVKLWRAYGITLSKCVITVYKDIYTEIRESMALFFHQSSTSLPHKPKPTVIV